MESNWLGLAERFGIPFACLIALAVAVWRTIVWVGNNVVKPITASHIALVESTKETNRINADTLMKMGDCLDNSNQFLNSMANEMKVMTAVLGKSIGQTESGAFVAAESVTHEPPKVKRSSQ